MDQVDVVVVGAGFAGLYQLYRLRELGLTSRVFEAASGVGGTWYWNRYPGARCDVESLSYSYSFSPELEQEWEWSEKYATQPEIMRYLEHVADRFDLRSGITFDTRVTAAEFDEGAARWTVRTDTGEEVSAQFLVMATGCLSAAKAPEVPGADRFAGEIHHTGGWPQQGVDVTGKRVAVIGTGSSGVQSIPLLAAQAAELTVFQRTPNFSMPALNRPLDPAEVAERKARYPEMRQKMRESGFGLVVELPTESALEVSVDERTAAFQKAWDSGVLVALPTTFTDIRLDLEANATAADFVHSKIREIVEDPATADVLCPRSYPLGTKRLCLDTDYFATYNAAHVGLVDLRATPLVELTEAGVRTTDAEYPVDVVVFATGFDAMTGALLAVDIRGRGGRTLRAAWAEGPRTYLGVSVAGFPNLFTITGPGSPSVLSNMVVSIEQHVEWIGEAISEVRRRESVTIEATDAAQDGWVAHVAELGNATLYPRAGSWYMGANVPGKPRVFMPYIGGVGPYRQKCAEVAATGYAGFALA